MRKRYAIGRGTKMLLLILMMFVTTQLFASHFRYGNITATRLSETSTTVTYRLNVTTAWRLGTGDPNSFTISGGNSGFINVPMSFVTDPSGGWTNGTGTATVTLNKSNTPTRIEWSSCCKISDLANNRDSNWDVFTVINTNAPGSSPVSTLPAIVNMPINAAAATFTIPASDPDAGSTLTYALAPMTGFLAGQTQPSGLSINPATGQITFDTRGKSINQLYNAMVTVTDNNGNLIELDFIIKMVGASNPPVFDYNTTPTNGSVFNVIAGQNISFPIRASDPDLGSTVGLSVSGLPSYITTGNFSPAMPATGNPSQTNFSWTPAAAQIGNTVVLNFIATDNVGVQSTTSVTIKVVAEPAPVFINPTPGEASIRQIVTGALHQDVITAQSSLGSNVSIAFATIPGGSLSPSVPTAGANPGTTTFSWTPTPANWGEHTFNFQATISNIPSIFSSRSYKLIVNTPPVFTSSPSVTSVNAGQAFTYNITVNDPDLPYGDQLDITAAALPSWLTLVDNHNGTATLSGTPTAANGGTFHIHMHAEDIYHHGNPVHVGQEFDITVVTNKPPVALCRPRNVATNANCQGNIAATAFNNGSFDPDGDAITFSVSPAGPYNKGTTNVILTVTDSKGASSSCATTVTVIDNVLPTIVAPAAITMNAPQGQCAVAGASVVLGSPVTADNCSGVVSTSNDAPSVYRIGSTFVTWTAVDAAGNINIATQKVTVVNSTPPVISATSPVAVNNDPNACGANVNITVPSASSFCAGNECGTDNIDSYVAGNVSGQSPRWTPWPGGSSAVVSSAQSFSASNSVKVSDFQDQLYLLGNKTAGKWTVKWKMFIPTGRTGYFNTQKYETAGFEWGQQVQFGSTGNAALQVAGTFTTFSYPQGQWFDVEQRFDLDADQSTLYINGAAIKTWQFSSQANSATGTKQLGGLDFFASTSNIGGIEPNLSAISTYYIDDISFCGSGEIAVMGTRNDSLPLSASYPVGTTTITWSVTDAGGLSSSTTQTVTVTDNQAPVITAPANVSTQVNASGCGATTNLGSPVTADNCGVASVTNNAPATFAVGTTTVTWTVTDIHGNSATATQTVTVANNLSVSINNPSTLAQGVDANTIYIGYTPASVLSLTANPTGSQSNAYSYNWTVSGNLQISGANNAQTVNVTATNSGSYVVTLTVTDGYGCTKTITKQLNVVDVRCGNKNEKVLVCQKTGSAKNPWVQICIAPSAVATHLANGSTLGNCPTTASRNIAPEVIAKATAGKIYPNPNKGVFELQLTDYTPGKVQVQVMDNYGKLVSSQSIVVSAKTENFSFNMSKQASGVYYVRVASEEGVKTLRIVVTK